MSLIELDCRHAKPKEKAYRLFDTGGLYLNVTPTGKRVWRFKYHIHGKEKLLTLGQYPSLSLVKAREKRDAAKEDLQNSIDPAAAKQQEKRLAKFNAAQTFELVGKEWHERYKSRWSKRHSENLLYRLEQYIIPCFGKVPLKDVTPPIVLSCVQKIENRGANELARRVLQLIGQVFRYAVITGRVERDITRDMKGALMRYSKGHFASIEVDQFPELIKKLNRNDARMYRQTILAMKLMMLTFVRTSELIGAQWDEINFEKAEWNIPAERMKMKTPHIVPLARQALEILQELKGMSGKSIYVFPSKTKANATLSNTAILMGLRRLDYYKKMTGHGFRSLAMGIIKEKLGYQHDVVDRQLAHLPRSKIDQAYDRAKFIPQRIKMMQDYADYIDSVS